MARVLAQKVSLANDETPLAMKSLKCALFIKFLAVKPRAVEYLTNQFRILALNRFVIIKNTVRFNVW